MTAPPGGVVQSLKWWMESETEKSVLIGSVWFDFGFDFGFGFGLFVDLSVSFVLWFCLY